MRNKMRQPPLYTSPYQEKPTVMQGQRKHPEKCPKALLLFIMLNGVTREPTQYFLCDFYQMHCNSEFLSFWGPRK